MKLRVVAIAACLLFSLALVAWRGSGTTATLATKGAEACGDFEQQEPGSFPFTPPLFCDAILSPLDLAGKTATLETVGDTEANHIHIDAAPLSAASKLFGENSDNGKLLKSYDVDLWLAKKDGRLVKVQAVANASFPYGRAMSSTLSLETSSFNDD